MNSWDDLKFWDHAWEVWEHITGDHYPRGNDVYRAFNLTPMNEVRCVILGQDPYHTAGYADGLAFSVPNQVTAPLSKGGQGRSIPPTLRNIFRELTSDIHCPYPSTTSLEPWAKQGVLLLNTSLTVAPGKAGSHKDVGWSSLITEVLSELEKRSGFVFCLWGKAAQEFLPLVMPAVGSKRNSVILSSHPSPLSASKGFLGSRPFTTINSCLSADKRIDWRLP